MAIERDALAETDAHAEPSLSDPTTWGQGVIPELFDCLPHACRSMEPRTGLDCPVPNPNQITERTCSGLTRPCKNGG
jgi:hypothetical protein